MQLISPSTGLPKSLQLSRIKSYARAVFPFHSAPVTQTIKLFSIFSIISLFQCISREVHTQSILILATFYELVQNSMIHSSILPPIVLALLHSNWSVFVMVVPLLIKLTSRSIIQNILRYLVIRFAAEYDM